MDLELGLGGNWLCMAHIEDIKTLHAMHLSSVYGMKVILFSLVQYIQRLVKVTYASATSPCRSFSEINLLSFKFR